MSFLVFARILPFPGTRPDSTIFRYSHWFYHFSKLVRTVFQYWDGFYLFPVLARILPFSGIHTDSTLFQNLAGQFFDFRTYSTFSRYSPESTIFWYSHWFYPFPVLARAVFRYLHLFYLFLVLAQILPFFGTHTDSTLLQYPPGQLFDIRTYSTFSWYSPRFYHFFGTLRTIFRYSHWFYPFRELVWKVFRYSLGF